MMCAEAVWWRCHRRIIADYLLTRGRTVLHLLGTGRVDPAKVNEKVLARYLDEPQMPDVDLFVRSSGEQRISNFLLWQSAYAEMVFQDTLWPDYDRRDLWEACEEYVNRNRRFGRA